MEQKQRNKQKEPEDLISVLLGLGGGAIYGLCGSYFDPLLIPRCVELSLAKKSGLSEIALATGALGTYLLSCQHIVSKIVENPENPTNYIPLVTNLISGITQGVYCYRKRKKHLEEKVEKDR